MTQQATTDILRPHGGPIFIVGAPRSGTTMLQYRLRNHPRISLPTGESHFFVPLLQRQMEFGDLRDSQNIARVLQAMHRQSREFLETDLHGMKFDVGSLAMEFAAEGRHTVAAIISGLFEKNARGEEKARWGDKTPYYVLHIPMLLRWWPDAQIIHIIRDGRDVALSLFGRRHDFRVYNAFTAGEYWNRYVEKGHAFGAQLRPEQYLEVRYEDMLAQPQDSLRRICQFLGEEYLDSLLDVEAVADPGKTPLVHKPIKADNAGKWRQKMTPGQIRAFEAAAGGTLTRFGYELATDDKPLFPGLATAYRLHNRLVTAYWRRRQ